MVSKRALDVYVPTQERKFKNRHLIVGASEIGQCERKIGYQKKSQDARFIVDRDPDYNDSYGARTRGNVFEEFWVKAMEHYYGKENFIMAGKQQRSWSVGALSGTPDSILINQKPDALKHLYVKDIKSDCFIVDVKTIDPRINLSTAKPEHIFQIKVQLGLLNELSNYKPHYGVLSYHNASFVDDVTEFVFEYDPKLYARAKVRATKILNSKSAAELLPEGWIAGGDECKYCPFQRSCAAIRGDVPHESGKKPSPELAAQLVTLARQYNQLSTTVSSLGERQRKMQHEIKELLRGGGLRRIEESGIRIIWSPVKGRPAYDMPAFKAAAEEAGIDINQFETVGEPTDRLQVTILPRSTVQSAKCNSTKDTVNEQGSRSS